MLTTGGSQSALSPLFAAHADTRHMDANLLTSGQVARRLGVSTTTVRRLVTDGSLAAVRLRERGDLRFLAEDVERLVAERRREAAVAA